MLQKTLPRDYYFTAEHYAQEKERIFAREWVCVGRGEQIPQPGDFLAVEMMGESLLVLRAQAGEVRAFYNVCRHRGCRLHLGSEVSGHFPGVIRCPYHAWSYTLDGQLNHAPFLAVETAEQENFRLYPVGVALWGGFIFLNLSPDSAQPLDLGPAVSRLGNYPLADLCIAQTLVYEVQANWKVILENYNECYHCAVVHPELCAIVPAFRQQGGAGLDWEQGIPHAPGTNTFTLSGTTHRAAFKGLNEIEKNHHKGELLYPNLMISLSMDHVAAFTLWPQSATKTTIVCDFLFDPDEIAKPDFDPKDAVEFWDLVNWQDWKICEGTQLGMASRVFEQGYYAPMEDYSADIRRYIEAKLDRKHDEN